MKHYKYSRRRIDLFDLIFRNTFFNDSRKTFAITATLIMKIRKIRFVKMFPFTITNDHLFKCFDHLLDVKTKKCFNFFDRSLVTGFQFIHKMVKRLATSKQMLSSISFLERM